jgi:hypothetical protein
MSELLKPPAVPLAILNFFAAQPDFPALAGDISEEFHQRAQSSGADAAKRWYWREAFRNAFALTWRELMRTPLRTTLLAIGCLVVANLAIVLFTVTSIRYRFVAEDHLFDQSRRNVFLLLLLLNFIPPLALGWIGARLLAGREWALALTFTLVSACLALMGAGYVFFVLKQGLPISLRVLVSVGNALAPGFFLAGLPLDQAIETAFD